MTTDEPSSALQQSWLVGEILFELASPSCDGLAPLADLPVAIGLTIHYAKDDVGAYWLDTGTPQTGINSLQTYFDRGASMMALRLKDRAKVDPRVTVRVVFGAVLASVMFRDWMFPPGLANDEEITAAVNDFIREGIHANLSFEPGST